MAVTELQSTTGLKPIVNDFCMTVCTVNGSGSATANNIIYRALYQMVSPYLVRTFSHLILWVWQHGLLFV